MNSSFRFFPSACQRGISHSSQWKFFHQRRVYTPRERRCSKSQISSQWTHWKLTGNGAIWNTNYRSKQNAKEERKLERANKWTRKGMEYAVHSDIKLILFIMHQSNRALLARAYIMQKQVFAFPLLLALFFWYLFRLLGFSRFAP